MVQAVGSGAAGADKFDVGREPLAFRQVVFRFVWFSLRTQEQSFYPCACRTQKPFKVWLARAWPMNARLMNSGRADGGAGAFVGAHVGVFGAASAGAPVVASSSLAVVSRYWRLARRLVEQIRAMEQRF